MAGTPPQAILFDIGQVIVRLDLDRAAEMLGRPTGLSAQQVLERVNADPKLKDLQEGRLTPAAWHEHLKASLRLPYLFDEFCSVWNGILSRTPILEDALFRELGLRFKLGLLSNTDPFHVAFMEKFFGFPKYFPARVYSCTAGTSKPRPEIYAAAARELGTEPQQILYVDDVPEYVAAGERAGMQVIRFVDRETLLSELRRRGVLA